MKRISLTQGKTTIVSDRDFKRVGMFFWYALKSKQTFYAVRNVKATNGKWTSISMHRAILGTPGGMQTDHINGDGLDNRRKNLRVCTRPENGRNRRRDTKNPSGYKGVHLIPKTHKYRAVIQHLGRKVYLPTFSNSESAAKAYDRMAKKLYGKFARLNFP